MKLSTAIVKLPTTALKLRTAIVKLPTDEAKLPTNALKLPTCGNICDLRRYRGILMWAS
jgi:hypothetical protein